MRWIHVCLLELSGIFFPPNVADLWLVKTADAEPMDTEGQMYTINTCWMPSAGKHRKQKAVFYLTLSRGVD